MPDCRTHRFSRRLFTCEILVGLFLIGCFISIGKAQEPTDANENSMVPAASVLTIEDVLARLKKLEENKEVDPALKTRLTEIYTKTAENLKAAAESQGRAVQLAKLGREAPDSLSSLKLELAAGSSASDPVIPKDATLAQVQQLLSQAELNLSESQKTLQNLQYEPKRRAARRLEMPKLVEAAKLQLQEIATQLEAKPSPDEPAEVSAATRNFLEARKQAISSEIEVNQAELPFFEATGELLSAQRDRAAQRVANAEEQVKFLRSVVNERRRKDAEQQALDAIKASAQAHSAVRKIAQTNAGLAELRKSLAEKIEATTRELEQIDAQVTEIDEQFKKVTTRFQTAGGTEAIGLLLRKQRDELVNSRQFRRKSRQRTTEISNTYLDLIDYEEKRNELATLDQRVKSILIEIDRKGTDAERKILEEEIRAVLEAQRSVYDSLISDTNSCLDKLIELDVHEHQLIDKAEEFAKYCDERILWIRSATILGLSNVRQLLTALAWLVDSNNWKEIFTTLRADAIAHPAINALAYLLLLILMLSRRSFRNRLKDLSERAARNSITSYTPTLRAFFVTGLLSLALPGLIGYVGFRLAAAENGSEFVGAIGHGMLLTAMIFVTLELFRLVCHRNGLGESHFGWDPESLRVLRSTTMWFIVASLPLILVITITESQPTELIKNSLGRIAFITELIISAFCVHRIMRPHGGIFERAYAAAPQSWISRLKLSWYYLALGVPVSLAILALSGYYYTATQLSGRLLATWWLVIGLLVLHAALIRWSLLTYRDLAMRKARERRAADANLLASASSTPSAAAAKIVPEVQLSEINKQTRKALQLGYLVALVAGLWFVWIDILPALGALGQVGLWQVEVTGISGSTAAPVLQWITLANVAMSIAVACLTFAGSRNLPSLLEIAVLQRLPLDPGVRYAITTVCRYVITIVGLITAFAVIGIGWNKVQWLVAGVSVGLGFGLQEIFANFVSGLILLFERPVRPGDIVTVGDVTGHITRIQMRATTITDWDMRELIVPNREFITGRVMNWTLTSTISRMSIDVGTAYGTDPDTVRNLLLQVASRNPLVLKDPPPHALFDQFNESRLNFILRVYMASRDVYLELRHGLLTEIASEFQQAGIEFAFPQQDIHIRTSDVPSQFQDR